jgi:hypothetical protein
MTRFMPDYDQIMIMINAENGCMGVIPQAGGDRGEGWRCKASQFAPVFVLHGCKRG